MGNQFQSSAWLPGLRAWAAPLTRRALLGGLLCATVVALAQPTATETELKAAILIKFPSYFEWPKNPFTNATQPIVLGILADDPIGKELEASIRAFKVPGRPVQARRLLRVEEAKGCHLLYLSPTEPGKLKSLLAALQGQPILTTGDHPDFLKLGGVLRLWRNGDNFAFHINTNALREAQITADARLLKLSAPATSP